MAWAWSRAMNRREPKSPPIHQFHVQTPASNCAPMATAVCCYGAQSISMVTEIAPRRPPYEQRLTHAATATYRRPRANPYESQSLCAMLILSRFKCGFAYIAPQDWLELFATDITRPRSFQFQILILVFATESFHNPIHLGNGRGKLHYGYFQSTAHIHFWINAPHLQQVLREGAFHFHSIPHKYLKMYTVNPLRKFV